MKSLFLSSCSGCATRTTLFAAFCCGCVMIDVARRRWDAISSLGAFDLGVQLGCSLDFGGTGICCLQTASWQVSDLAG